MAHLFRNVNVDETFGVRFLDHLPRVLCLDAQVRSRNHISTGWSECADLSETRRDEAGGTHLHGSVILLPRPE